MLIILPQEEENDYTKIWQSSEQNKVRWSAEWDHYISKGKDHKSRDTHPGTVSGSHHASLPGAAAEPGDP